MHNIAVIILAAGASMRLGQPKQLLPYRGTTLLQHIVQTAARTQAAKVIAVLGAHEAAVRPALNGTPALIAVNHHWGTGMASSIKCGLAALTKAMPQAEAALLMLCDQPYVTSAHLNTLIETHLHTGKPIVASGYAGSVGAPALFHKSMFAQLLQLSGDAGARAIIQRNMQLVHPVDFPEGSVDIDTMADYEGLG